MRVSERTMLFTLSIRPVIKSARRSLSLTRTMATTLRRQRIWCRVRLLEHHVGFRLDEPRHIRLAQ